MTTLETRDFEATTATESASRRVDSSRTRHRGYALAQVLGIILFLVTSQLAAPRLFGADITVPALELTTRGYLDAGSFALATRGNVEFQIAGGFKFGGQVRMSFESDDLEDPLATDYLAFDGASIAIRSPLGLPLDLVYFTGENDTFGSGDIFPAYFGARSIASRFRGYLYFPDPDQIRYDGIHTVSGTGVEVTTSFLSNWNTTSLFFYQDTYLGSGTYSADLWTAINLDRFKMEGFVGASFPASTWGYYRAGLLLFYDTGQGGEFLTQIGVPRWDPYNDPVQLDLFYLLFEPRVRFGLFSIVLTLFWHPEYYLQTETYELGSADINAKFQFGEPERSTATGGIETQLAFSSTGDDQFKAVAAPFLSLVTSGVIWDFKVNAKVFPFDLSDIVEMFIGVRAQY